MSGKTFLPKSEWGKGPWQSEPDKLEWRDKKTGLPCMIVRNTEVTGALCGYVGVHKGDPLFEKHHANVDVDVHGGLTFSDKCHGHICHTPEPEEPEVWWFGFDCAHSFDLMPAMAALMRQLGRPELAHYKDDTYKDIEYVKKEVTKLAEQIAELNGPIKFLKEEK